MQRTWKWPFLIKYAVQHATHLIVAVLVRAERRQCHRVAVCNAVARQHMRQIDAIPAPVGLDASGVRDLV